MRESIPRQVDKKSGVLEEERGGWSSQGGEKDKCPLFFFFLSLSLSTFLSLSHIKGFLFLFSLSLELMITQQTTQFKLCIKDYITTIHPA